MKTWYVELERKISFGQEVRAETQEAAENAVILAAGEDPRDWTITASHEVQRHGATVDAERGAVEILS